MIDGTSLYQQNLPTIALVGRVNVGKSTLFNKLIENQQAIVSDIPGTTRTSNEGIVTWRARQFKLIDTGGLTFTDDIPLEEDIIVQSERAMKEADMVLFITDAKEGILPQEQELAKRLRRIVIKPVVLVANKVDNKKIRTNLTEKSWFSLGLGEPFAISASSGKHVGDLLDHVFDILETHEAAPRKENEHDVPIQVALIGKPNVGKSSLFNKLIGQERVIVSDMAHTTREPHDTLIEYEYDAPVGAPLEEKDDDHEEKKPAEEALTLDEVEHTERTERQKVLINFIDTAGIRRKARVEGLLEREGIHKSIAAVDATDIVLFVLDGSDNISTQDMQLGGLLQRKGKSVIIIINKWDLAEDNSEEKRNAVKKMVYSHFPHLDFAPILFTSGLTGKEVHKVFPMLLKIRTARNTEITTRTLEKFLKYTTKKHRPARGKGTRHPKLLGMRQLGTSPPVFEVVVKYRTSLHRSYVSYLQNRLREQFDFFATPIIIKLTKTRK